MEKDQISLEKSHSKWSNFLLTCLCLLVTISVSVIWVMITFIKYIDILYVALIITIASIILILSVSLLYKFKR